MQMDLLNFEQKQTEYVSGTNFMSVEWNEIARKSNEKTVFFQIDSVKYIPYMLGQN